MLDSRRQERAGGSAVECLKREFMSVSAFDVCEITKMRARGTCSPPTVIYSALQAPERRLLRKGRPAEHCERL